MHRVQFICTTRKQRQGEEEGELVKDFEIEFCLFFVFQFIIQINECTTHKMLYVLCQ